MKSFRSTGLMLLIVGALAGYTLWDYRKAMKNEGVDVELETKLFSLASDDVLELNVQQKEALIQLKREGALWRMLKPVADEADSSAVEAFLYSALIQKGKFFRAGEEAKATNWSDYGLEPPGSTIELKSAKATETLQVSSKNAFDGSYYVRRGEELLLGDRGLAQLVGRAPNSLRQRRLWRDTESTIQRADIEVDYEGLKEKFAIVLKGDKWELEPKPVFAYDSEKVANWLVLLERLTAQEVAADLRTEASEEKKSFLLTRPSVRATLHLKKANGEAAQWVFTAGQDRAEDAFAMASSQPTVYKLPAQNLKPFRVSTSYFRDGKKPFQFPVEQAHQIEAYSEGKLYKFIKDGSLWKTDGEASELQSDQLVGLVESIHRLEALEFLPARSGTGFKPEQRVVIRDLKGTVLLDLSWGAPYPSARTMNKGMTFRYARTNLEKDEMGVSVAGVNNLSLVLAKKAEKK